MQKDMAPPIKIARTIPSFYPSVTGPANQAFNISKKLFEGGGIRTHIFASTFGAGSSPHHETIAEGIEVTRVPISRTFMQFFVTPGLIDELKNFDPDIVHTHGYRNYQTEAAYDYCTRYAKPLVISTHGTAQSYKFMSTGFAGNLPYVSYDKLRGLKQLRHSKAIVVNSSREEAEVAELIGKERSATQIVRIPMGYDLHQPKRDNDSEVRILFVARITADRDPRPLIRALQKVKNSHPTVRLRIVGSEAVSSASVKQRNILDESRDLVRDLGLTGRVDFLGELHGEALASEYEFASIFVYNSKYENFGQPIMEAASYGIPIVAPNVGVAQDAIEDGVSGFFSSADDAESFASKIEILLANESLRKEMGKRIQEKVRSDYNWENIISKYSSLYRGILHKE
jgi:colanic acid/amylovoran biosynthesis glycosyltransferase